MFTQAGAVDRHERQACDARIKAKMRAGDEGCWEGAVDEVRDVGPDGAKRRPASERRRRVLVVTSRGTNTLLDGAPRLVDVKSRQKSRPRPSPRGVGAREG